MPQVLENCPVLGSRTALFFELLNFCISHEKNFRKAFFTGEHLKKFLKTFFLVFFFEIVEKKIWQPFYFEQHLRLCPFSAALASSIPVLGLERVYPQKGCPWPWPRIFLCSWPWPRALCPQPHLCSLYLSLVVFQLGSLHYRLCYSIKLTKNVKQGPGVATFRTKLLDFLQVLHLNY